MGKTISERVKMATVAVAVLNRKEVNHPFTIVGSGFCIDKKGIVVTCRHVIETMMAQTVNQQITNIPPTEQEKKMYIGTVQFIAPHAVFYNTTGYSDRIAVYPSRVEAMAALTDFDLAILKLLPHPSFPSGYPTLDVSIPDEITEGDDVSTCGFPLGNFLHEQLGTVTSSFTKGIISSIIPASNARPPHLKGYQLNVTATHGNSGGPVFSLKSGKVVGVLQGGVVDQNNKILQGLSFAEPLYPLLDRRIAESLKQPPKH